ncbi:MAG: hypothetical protein AAF629_27515 [Chloroflexota bacterium]
MTEYEFYPGYTAPIPQDNYAIFEAGAFVPFNYLIIDFNVDEIFVYAPYQERGLISCRHLTDEDKALARDLLSAKTLSTISEDSENFAFDALTFSVKAKIQGKTFFFSHILPEDKKVLEIYALYETLTEER